MNSRALPLMLVTLALLGGLPAAQANTVTDSDTFIDRDPNHLDVLVNRSEFVDGNSAQSMQFVLPTAGELTLDFKDLDFTGALDSFEFGLSNTSSSLSGMITGDGMTLDLTKPTTLYLDTFARAGSQTGVGLYNIVAFFQPIPQTVPLPASALSLAGGLGALFWICRRRRQTIVMSAVA
jgi:hypothetical protein